MLFLGVYSFSSQKSQAWLQEEWTESCDEAAAIVSPDGLGSTPLEITLQGLNWNLEFQVAGCRAGVTNFFHLFLSWGVLRDHIALYYVATTPL